MRRGIVFRPRARRDLDQVWTYTARNWGAGQADEYVGNIDEAIKRIAEQPELGSGRSYIRDGLRKLTVASHAIYYFHDERMIRVSRILHVRRDAESQLGPAT